MVSDDFKKNLETFSSSTFQYIDKIVKKKHFSSGLLHKVLPEYPSRKGKGIRPALCIGACMAAGGTMNDAINSASSVELLHNAVLGKDDVVDLSILRRSEKTLFSKYGSSVAINVSDAMAVLAIKLLINNVQTTGVHTALEIINEIQKMAIHTVDGQAIELEWTIKNQWELNADDYYDMCTKKTSWYTAASPCIIGAMIGNPDITESQKKAIAKFGLQLGLGFQIQDDLLNLMKDKAKYGKEVNGDIWEGKRTLVMIKMYENATLAEKRILRKTFAKNRSQRTQKEVLFVRKLMDKYDCIKECSKISNSFARRAINTLDTKCSWLKDKKMTMFLREMAMYVVERNK